MAAIVSHLSFLVTFCCILFAHVDSKPLHRQQKRNSPSQSVLRRCGNNFDSATQFSTEYQYLPEADAPRLPERSLSWKIVQYPVEIDNYTTVESVNLATNQALNLWSSVANLQFHHIISGTPDIEMKFQVPKAHNRQCVGEFSTGIIAHYVSGSINPGKIHFNEQYEWTTTRFDSRNRSVNLVTAIAHEIGHLLGFDHTIVPNSIMYPSFPNIFTAPIVLSRDDISAATNRYGVRIHSHPTTTIPISTTQSLATASTTTGSYGCTAPTNTFFDTWYTSLLVCSTLYELENCRGSYVMTSNIDTVFSPFSRLVSSLVVAPSCRAIVCGGVGGNHICSANLTGSIPSLDIQFGNRIRFVYCECDDCSVPFPLMDPNKTICAAAYSRSTCRSEAMLFSPGAAWLRNSSEYWQNPYSVFLSAQVNPSCTANFCHSETINNHNCLTLNGGANGQSYPKLDSIFMRIVTAVHCSCLP